MPIYEYECQSCLEITEAIQKFSDKPLKICPLCKGRLKKLVSHNTFHLKGSGWYVTDYAGKRNTPSTSKPKEEADSTSKSEDSTSGSSKKADTKSPDD